MIMSYSGGGDERGEVKQQRICRDVVCNASI